MPKIKMTRDYLADIPGHGLKQLIMKGSEWYAQSFSENGWAEINSQYGRFAVPYGHFQVSESPQERTYTESEVKAIRQEWEDLLGRCREVNEIIEAEKNHLEKALDENYEKFEKLEGIINQIQGCVQQWSGDENKLHLPAYVEQLTRRAMDEDLDDLSARQERDALKKKLHLLEPEIKRIEESIRVAVPGYKAGSLAEHVDSICKELVRRRAQVISVGDEVEIYDHFYKELIGLRGRVKKRCYASGGMWLVLDIPNPLLKEPNQGVGVYEQGVILLTRKGQVAFHNWEDEHPEENLEAQNKIYEDSIAGWFENYEKKVSEALHPFAQAFREMVECLEKQNEAKARGDHKDNGEES